MGIQVPPVTMGAMCECGRGRVPSNLVVCYDCLEDRRVAFWEIYHREADLLARVRAAASAIALVRGQHKRDRNPARRLELDAELAELRDIETAIQAGTVFPVPGDRIRCGLRLALPRKQRGHLLDELGTDMRHAGPIGAHAETRVRACVRCGADRQGG